MKKFLAILAVAGVMAACNNGSDETPKTDSPAAMDSPVAPMQDTSHMGGDTSHMGGDTSNMKK